MTRTPLNLHDPWPASDERHMLSTALLAGGLTVDEAAVWLSDKPDIPMLAYLDEVLLWTDAFSSASEARAWYDTMILRDEAEAWVSAGYAADEANRIETECFLAQMVGRKVTHAPEWRTFGFSAEWIVACIAVGVNNPEDAETLLRVRP